MNTDVSKNSSPTSVAKAIPDWDKLSPFMQACIADGLAINHRFKAEPMLKHGTPYYKNELAVESISHAKQKRN